MSTFSNIQLIEHIVLKHSAAFVILISYINDDDEYLPVIMLYFSDSQMAKSLTQDRSQRTISYINDEEDNRGDAEAGGRGPLVKRFLHSHFFTF